MARLKPYACNAKTHDGNQVAKIAARMAEFGWTVPLLIAADGELIEGHGRVLAAAYLGRTEAPVIVLGHLTEGQHRAYQIADNKLIVQKRFQKGSAFAAKGIPLTDVHRKCKIIYALFFRRI